MALPSPLAHSWPSLVVAVHHSQFGMASIFWTTSALGGGDPGGGGGGGAPGDGGGGGVVAVVGGCAPGPVGPGVVGFPPHPVRMKRQSTLRTEKKNKVLKNFTNYELQETFREVMPATRTIFGFVMMRPIRRAENYQEHRLNWQYFGATTLVQSK